MQLTIKGEPLQDNQMNTLIIYEDNAEDTLQKLLMYYCHVNRPCVDIYHANAAGSIAPAIYKMYSQYKIIVAFLDVSPLNIHTVNMYNKLCGLQTELKDTSICILPIYCTEFLFLRSLYKMGLVSYNIDEKLMPKSSYLKHCLADKRMYKYISFKRYCKYLLENEVPDCISLKGDYGKLTEKYYTTSCACSQCAKMNMYSLLDKSLGYITEYPVYPRFEITQVSMTDLGLFKIQNELVEQYNHACDIIADLDILPARYRKNLCKIEPQLKI